uniref:Uncharacterized protein n=1 Tax=Knipowitschia caucasica TaxID=637954 RepID=A0AAV2L4C2_KNICA
MAPRHSWVPPPPEPRGVGAGQKLETGVGLGPKGLGLQPPLQQKSPVLGHILGSAAGSITESDPLLEGSSAVPGRSSITHQLHNPP